MFSFTKKNLKKFFNSRKNSLKKLNCSPISQNKKNNSLKNLSCYNDNNLLTLIKYWNTRHPDKKLLTNDPVEIWHFFKNTFNNVCKNEQCWLRQKFIENNNRNLLKYFSPKAPNVWEKKPYTWLNNMDIEKIMQQYEDAYPNFEFLGPSPIDFDKVNKNKKCVSNDLCKFSLKKKIKNNINKIGIIFNTDPHYKSGEHWICLFIDIKNKFISFFDSNGNKIPKQIKVFVDRIKNQGEKLGINFKYYDNYKIIHQNTDGQCGMYTLYYVIELLKENKTPEVFREQRISDEEMRDYRKIYFN